MKPLSRMTAIMVLLFSLSAVALAGDMDGPGSVVTPPPPVTDAASGNVCKPAAGGTNSNEDDLFSTRSLIDLLLATIF